MIICTHLRFLINLRVINVLLIIITLLMPLGMKYQGRFKKKIIIIISLGLQGVDTIPPYFSTPFFSSRFFFRNASVYLSAIHFHFFWCKNLEKVLLPRQSVHQKVKCLWGVVTLLPRTQLLTKIETKFQRLSPCFGVKISNYISRNAVRPNRKWQIQDDGHQTEVPIS